MSKRRHILLAFLGTNFYREASYVIAGAEGRRTRFVQVALVEHILREIDPATLNVRVFCTAKATELNWTPPPKRPPARGAPEEDYQGLDDALSQLGPRVLHEAVPIPDGKNEEEYWSIFQRIVDSVHKEDHVYVDVTHGYRSLPVLLTKALDYLVQVKRVEVRRLDYGAFEANHENPPVFDLRPFLVIDDWARAVATFRHGGDLLALAGTLEEQVKALRRVHRAGLASEIGRLPGRVEALAEALEFCRLADIAESALRLQEALGEAEGAAARHDTLRPLMPLLRELIKTIKPMAGGPDPASRIRAQVAATRFLFKHQRYLNGYTLLRETLVDVIEAHVASVPGCEGMSRRQLDAGVFSHFAHHGDFGGEDAAAADPTARALRHLRDQPWAKDFHTVASAVCNERNKLDHAGTGEPVPKADRLCKNAKRQLAHLDGVLDRALGAAGLETHHAR